MNIKEIGGFSSSWLVVLLVLPVALLAASYAVVVGAVVGAYRELRDVVNTF